MRVAFYKGTRPGLQGLYSRAVRLWTHSPYSHCELVFSDGLAGSASFIDGGVRVRKIEFDPTHWDFVDVPGHLELAAESWFNQHHGEKYDLLGNVHFLFALLQHDKRRWFCSESVAEALGMADSWRFSPGDLYAALTAPALQQAA